MKKERIEYLPIEPWVQEMACIEQKPTLLDELMQGKSQEANMKAVINVSSKSPRKIKIQPQVKNIQASDASM